MAHVDLVDETFIAVPPAELIERVNDPVQWQQWWPDLQLTVFMNRGLEGVRWSITGALTGSCELWLEPVLDGTLVHFYLRGTTPESPTGSDGEMRDSPAEIRRGARQREKRAKAWKLHVWKWKDEAEHGRNPGEPPQPIAESPNPSESLDATNTESK